MTKLLYLTDSYKKELVTKVVAVKKTGNSWFVELDETIFYPQGGGQPSDKGVVRGNQGTFTVTHARMMAGSVILEGMLVGDLKRGEQVTAVIDWNTRYDHMRWHSAGHVLHEAVMETVPGLMPVSGEHGKHAYIEYEGTINPKLKETLEKKAQMLVAHDLTLHTEMVSLDELKKRSAWVPEKLPVHKPLRILQIEGYQPIPDGGTQVKKTGEVGTIRVTEIERLGNYTRVHYVLPEAQSRQASPEKKPPLTKTDFITTHAFRSLILEQEREFLEELQHISEKELEKMYLGYFGSHGRSTQLIKRLKDLPESDRKNAGILVNEYKSALKNAYEEKKLALTRKEKSEWFDTSLPGIRPPKGYVHLVTQAIIEITRIFERIGFTRVRHPEVDWDWYAFESLNMPPDHPARDEWETFFIENQKLKDKSHKFSQIVLTPHTSNGQVREMEKGQLPIRMINIAKCYRRQSDVSHVPMFHQFEGLYVDHNVSISHLKGVIEYFFKEFYSPDRKVRLRPFHFQFTEPSFEIDVSCGVCLGKGCKLCKDGWLELGGAGMVHPIILKNGGIDPNTYNGFAFGWGIERTYMMKSDTQLDDIRLLYSNDIRFLEQF